MKTSQRASYDSDFFAWTQDQAAALRCLSPALVGNAVDIEHIAEEIEDLGKRDVREVESYLRQLFVHLLKIAALPHAQERTHWIAECEEFQSRAAETYKPSMDRVLDISRAWELACRSAAIAIEEMNGTTPTVSTACPIALERLVSTKFDLRSTIQTIANLAHPTRPETI